MAQQLINIGIADQGNGDPLRTAFNKVNTNFSELYQSVSQTTIVVDSVPPDQPELGAMWYDTVGGRIYIYYDNNWVDISPDNVAIDVVAVPSTNTSAGTVGQFAYDSNYIYMCVNTNQWRRFAIDTGW